MFKKAFVTLLWCAVVAAPLRADLKFTTHTEMKPVPGAAPAAPANPLIAMIGAQLTQQLLPGGPADVVFIVGPNGVRTEFVKGGSGGASEGTIILTTNGGEVIQLNSKDKTYWKSTMTGMAAMVQSLGMQPEVTMTPSSETATIAGVRAKRSDFAINIPLPIPPEMLASLPPGIPKAVVMNGEIWSATTPFEKYLPLLAKSAPLLGGLGMGKLMESGVMLRQVMRSELFSGQQLEMNVTQIGEESVAASLFAIPADYKEVPSPIK